MTFGARKRGFTLIEILAAMAVLSILMLILSRIFNETTKAWDLGTADSENNIAGRAVMEYIVRDISQAIADQGVEFFVNNNVGPAHGENYDTVYFVELDQDPSRINAKRASGMVAYYLRPMRDEKNRPMGRYRLMRSSVSDIGQPNPEMLKLYRTGVDWTRNFSFGGSQPVAENVTAFQIRAYHDTAGAIANGGTPNYNRIADYHSDNFNGQLPSWLDIYLEVMPEKDAVRLALLDPNVAADKDKIDELRDQRGQGYQARVYFRNRAGYLLDR